MDDRPLYGKYRVERNDGRPIVRGCFVLEIDDPKAWPALRAYADTCEEAGNLGLATDLRAIVDAEESLTRPAGVGQFWDPWGQGDRAAD